MHAPRGGACYILQMFLGVIFWGGLGLIFGSFTNVLIARHDSGKTLGGRSECPSCHRKLRWFELVPILSWVVLLGRCRTCHAGISVQYPLVELLVTLGFLGVGLAPTSLIVRVLGCAAVVLLIAVAGYDIRHMLMPDIWVYGFVALSFLLGTLAFPAHDFVGWILFGLTGPLVALPLFLLARGSRETWMGYGDVKFALGMGWLLGIALGYVALCFAFIIGALIGVCILLPLDYVRTRIGRGITGFHSGENHLTIKSEIPFGPFLICGTYIVWFFTLYNLDLIHMLADFSGY